MSKEIYSISGITDSDAIKKEANRAVKNCFAGFEYEVFGDESLDEIIEIAKKDWDEDATMREIQRRNRPRGRRHAQYRPDDDKLAVGFLRHQRTSYDWKLGQNQHCLLEVKPVDEDGENLLEEFFDEHEVSAHEVTRSKTFDAIRARFPELAGALARRQRSNYVMSGGRPFYVARPRWRSRLSRTFQNLRLPTLQLRARVFWHLLASSKQLATFLPSLLPHLERWPSPMDRDAPRSEDTANLFVRRVHMELHEVPCRVTDDLGNAAAQGYEPGQRRDEWLSYPFHGVIEVPPIGCCFVGLRRSEYAVIAEHFPLRGLVVDRSWP